MAGDVELIALLDTCFLHVLRVHEEDAATAFDTAVAVVYIVDGSVELVVTANGHH